MVKETRIKKSQQTRTATQIITKEKKRELWALTRTPATCIRHHDRGAHTVLLHPQLSQHLAHTPPQRDAGTDLDKLAGGLVDVDMY